MYGKLLRNLLPIALLIVFVSVSLTACTGIDIVADGESETGLMFKRYSVEEAREAFPASFDPVFPAGIVGGNGADYVMTVFYRSTSERSAVNENYIAFVSYPWIYSHTEEYGLSDKDTELLTNSSNVTDNAFNFIEFFPDLGMGSGMTGENMPVMFVAYSDMTLGDSGFTERLGKYVYVLESEYYDPYILDTFASETENASIKSKLWWAISLHEIAARENADEIYEVTVCYFATGVFRKDGVNYAVTYPVYAREETIRRNDPWGFNKGGNDILNDIKVIADKTMKRITDSFFASDNLP